MKLWDIFLRALALSVIPLVSVSCSDYLSAASSIPTALADEPESRRTVRFFSDGRLVSEASVSDGSPVAEPDVPEGGEGRKFVGWYTDGSFANECRYDFSRPVRSGLSLHAKWARITSICVASDGDDSSAQRRFRTVGRAVQEIISEAKPGDAYVIHVEGVVGGAAEIPEDVPAAAVDFVGGGPGAEISGGGSGTTISVRTAAPVSFCGVAITGGSGEDGGGLYVGAGAEVTLGDGASVRGNTAERGGGVFNEGTLLMRGSASVGDTSGTATAGAGAYSNRALRYGGGIYNKGRLFVGYVSTASKDSSFSGGIAFNLADEQGGAVYSEGAGDAIFVSGGKISFNRALRCGGGVRLAGSEAMRISGGEIAGNASMSSGSTMEGNALHIGSGSSVEMSGGSIMDNTGENLISAVCVNGSFTMSGGKIGGNRSSGTGTMAALGEGVHVAGSFTMSGAARVAPDNDVYLCAGRTVAISGSLSAASPVATITPSSYGAGTAVLSGSPALLSANRGKFGLRDTARGVEIGEDGKLAAGAVPTSGGAVGGSSFSSVGDLVAYLMEMKDSGVRGTLALGSGITAGELESIIADGMNNHSSPSSAVSLDLSKCTNIVEIGGDLFQRNCQWLAEIILPKSVRTIRAGAFQNLNNLSSVKFPSDSALEEIGDRAFSGGNGLAEISLPASLKRIGEESFRDTSLTAVTFASGSRLESIGSGAFSGATRMSSVTFPAGLREIGENAFLNAGLTSAVFSGGGTWTTTRGPDPVDVSDASRNAYNLSKSESGSLAGYAWTRS